MNRSSYTTLKQSQGLQMNGHQLKTVLPELLPTAEYIAQPLANPTTWFGIILETWDEKQLW